MIQRMTLFLTGALLWSGSIIPGPVSRFENITFEVKGSHPERISAISFRRFQQKFFQIRSALPENQGAGILPEVRVMIATDAGAFLELSGQRPHIAAIFLAQQRIFIFQNPFALERQGILETTIRHESCHESIHRFGNDPVNVPHQSALEESYCETLYPVSSISEGDFRGDHFPAKLEIFLEKRSEEMRSHDPDIVRHARNLLRALGTFLVSEIGRETFFAAAIGETSALEQLRKSYTVFRLTYSAN